MLAIFAGLQALSFANRFLLALLSAPIARALGIDDFHMGVLLGTAFIVPFVIFTPLFGIFTDRARGYWPMLFGLGLAAIAQVMCATANNFGALLAARILLGVGEAAVAPAALVQIARMATNARAGVGTALFAAGGPVGKGVVLTAGGALLGVFSRRVGSLEPWREVVWVAAAISLSALGFVWLKLAWRRGTSTSDEADDGTPPETPSDVHESRARLAMAAAAGALAVLSSQTAAIWAPSLFVRSFALTPARAGMMAGTPLLLLVPVCGLAAGWGLDRTGERVGRRPPTLAWLAALLVAAAAAALALWGAKDAVHAQLAFGALAGLLSAAAVCALRGVQLHAAHAARGRVTAGYIAAANLVGFGVGPPLVGLLAHSFGLSASLAMVIVGACLAGAAFLALQLPRAPRSARLGGGSIDTG